MKFPVMMDSGAYSAFTRRGRIDLDEYIAFLHKIIPWFDPGFFSYINLDIIGEEQIHAQQSYDNWKEMRRQGLDPIPVIHRGSGVRWLRRYLKQTDRISLGALANVSSTEGKKIILDHLWKDCLVSKEGSPLVKVHGLGITVPELIARYPWYSVDSTSWLLPSAYGKIFIPTWRNSRWDFNSPPATIGISTKSGVLGGRNQHLFTLTPLMKGRVLTYLRGLGLTIGLSEGEKIIERGLVNDYEHRCVANARYLLTMFLGNTWPRRLDVSEIHGGFFTSKTSNPAENVMLNGSPVLYFSGEVPIEAIIHEDRDRWVGSGVMLTYYGFRKGKNTRAWNRLQALAKGEKIERQKRRNEEDSG